MQWGEYKVFSALCTLASVIVPCPALPTLQLANSLWSTRLVTVKRLDLAWLFHLTLSSRKKKKKTFAETFFSLHDFTSLRFAVASRVWLSSAQWHKEFYSSSSHCLSQLWQFQKAFSGNTCLIKTGNKGMLNPRLFHSTLGTLQIWVPSHGYMVAFSFLFPPT